MRRYRRTLITAALVAGMAGSTAGWAVGGAQRAVTGPPPGSAAWRADGSLGRALPDPATASPYEVAAFYATLTPAERRELTRRHPTVVGNLDGAPVGQRYEANDLAIRATHDPRFARLTEPGRQILAFDPRGRGQVAEVYGDLTADGHIAVVVPGADIDLNSFDRRRDPYGTPAGMAASLRKAAGGRIATVAWTGYTTPVGVGVDAAMGDLAVAGAERLTRFTQGLVAIGAGKPALFCHSYGSVVCGLAAKEVNARDIVAFGSPGMRANTVADLGTRARVWAAKDTTDWISKVPNVEFAGLGHGTDPADKAFGARRVPATSAHGHTGYFAPGTDSLDAFVDIARGRIRRDGPGPGTETAEAAEAAETSEAAETAEAYPAAAPGRPR
ncbi:alpha/beta hydrolase [Streptomyces sp. NPDC093085]|uniref:alpha/beta hydrolase n=1 Tax=Streptomyces sp. NPDC093085 TaxID=3155068 RepID=UPI00341C5DCE